MATNKYPAALNRVTRVLNARTRKLHDETKAGRKNPEEAARLRRAHDELRADIKRCMELNHNRPQALAAYALSVEGAQLRAMAEKMTKIELRAAIPHLIERANNGDREARVFCGAMVGVIAAMPSGDRPITISKLSRMVNMPDYDIAATEIHEANFFLEIADRVLPRLEAGQLPTAEDLMVIGQKRRELEGGGWRDIATLAEATNELRLNPEKENADASPDSAEHEQPDNSGRQDSGGEVDPSEANLAPGGEANESGADQSRPENTEGETL